MLYELRTYDIVPGRQPDVVRRFQNLTVPVFERLGFRLIGFWTDEIGTSNKITYILAWEDLVERDRKFAEFYADKEFLEGRAKSEENGPIVAKITNSILRPTAFSPLK